MAKPQRVRSRKNLIQPLLWLGFDYVLVSIPFLSFGWAMSGAEGAVFFGAPLSTVIMAWWLLPVVSKTLFRYSRWWKADGPDLLTLRNLLATEFSQAHKNFKSGVYELAHAGGALLEAGIEAVWAAVGCALILLLLGVALFFVLSVVKWMWVQA